MKKLISVLLTFTFLFSSNMVLAENTTEEMERILVSVKNRVGDTEKYTEFNSNSYSTDSGTNYSFNWSFSDDKNHSSLSISCNDSGIITSYNTYDSKQYFQNKLSINGTKRKDALEIAKKEINKLNPEISDNLIVSDTEPFESFRNDGYNFKIQRHENGIPVLSDTGRISLDADCTLKNFYLNYSTGLEFENSDNTIAKNDAVSLHNQNIGLDLYYTSFYDNNNTHTAELIYAPKHDNRYIHAVTGEVYEIKENHIIGYDTALKQESALMNSAGGSNYRQQLSDAELKTVLEIEDLLSKEEADKIIRNCKYFNITNDSTIEQSSLTNISSKKEYYYNFSYRVGDFFADITLNAKNGEIISFSKWSDIPRDAVANTEKTNKLSNEVIKYLAPEKSKEFKLNKTDNKNSFSTTYTRFVNDIPFNENIISVSFDHEYNLTRYNISYDAIPFASPENIVSQEYAFNKMDLLGDYTIYYIPDNSNKKFVPVFNFTNNHVIDANTGNALYKNQFEENAGKYTDISGHYAENQIKTLSSYGIFLDGTELNPDEPITQKDFVALLSIIFYSRDVSILRNSYDIKDIYISLPDTFFLENEINPTAHLTRIEAAKLIVKAMGAEEYAKLSTIYAPLYKDVTEDLGYVNILTGMGVLSGDGAGNFHPDKEITKAHALIMIYNYLSR